MREKKGKKRPCFHGASVRESLKAYGYDDARRVTELAQRLIDAELMVPFKSSEGGAEFRDDRAYFFPEQLVMSRSYIADHLGPALTYFASAPYTKGVQATIVARRKKEKATVDLGIFGVAASDMSRAKEHRDKPAPAPSPSSSPAPASLLASPRATKASDVSASSAGLMQSAVMPPEQPPAPKLIEQDTDEIQFAFNDDDPIPVVKARHRNQFSRSGRCDLAVLACFPSPLPVSSPSLLTTRVGECRRRRWRS